MATEELGLLRLMMQSRSNPPQLHPLNDAAWKNFATTGKSDRSALPSLQLSLQDGARTLCAGSKVRPNKHSTNLSTLQRSSRQDAAGRFPQVTGNCASSHRTAQCVELHIGKLMRTIKGHVEFHKWWNDWISKRTQTRVLVEARPSGKKTGTDVERTADTGPSNLAHEPDAASGRRQ